MADIASEDVKEYRLRYVGLRFNGARLPLDVVSDLPAFRDLIAAFAKARWREDNADRKRLPKGFEQSISFDLVDIEEGSAVPAIAWSRTNAQRRLPGFAEVIDGLVDRAYDDAIALIESAAADKAPTELPVGVVRALNKLGSGLREDERIEFVGTATKERNVIYLDAERRRRLLRSMRQPYRTRTSGIGRLFALNIDEGFIDVETLDYGSVRIPVDPDEVKQVYDGNSDERVQYDLLVELDQDDNFRTVSEVYDVNLIDEEAGATLGNVGARLDQLAALQVGWNEGQGERVSAKAVDAVAQLALKRVNAAPRFHIFPTLLGGIQVEFDNDRVDLSIEFDADGKIDIFGFYLKSNVDLEAVSFDGLTEAFFSSFDDIISSSHS